MCKVQMDQPYKDICRWVNEEWVSDPSHLNSAFFKLKDTKYKDMAGFYSCNVTLRAEILNISLPCWTFLRPASAKDFWWF